MAWLIMGVFVVCAALMFTRRLPALLALPLMALAIALIASYRAPMEAISLVFGSGPPRLAGAMSNAIFGAILAYIVSACGIAQALVRRASELAGDRPRVVALLMMAVTAFAFLALNGLGAVIMIGTLVLPVMLGTGIRPLAAVSVFLFGISIGGMWNVAGWGFYQDVLRLPLAQVGSFATLAGCTLTLAGILYILAHATARRSTWQAEAAPPAPPARVSAAALLAPFVPVLLILGSQAATHLSTGRTSTPLEINAALAIGSLYAILTTRPREMVSLLAAAINEGIQSIAPVLGLMVGIGMVVTALMSPAVAGIMRPAIAAAVPHSRLGYVLFFGLLSPLALYRGPLNLYGLGAGIAAILTTLYAPHLALGALMATGIVQGVSDPTNTMNVWAGSFVQVDVNDILKSTLPFVFGAAFAMLAMIALTRW